RSRPATGSSSASRRSIRASIATTRAGSSSASRRSRSPRWSTSVMTARRTILCCALWLAAGCRQDMHDQPKYRPFRRSGYFSDGRTMRPVVDGTIARDEADDTSSYASGLGPDGPLARSPVAITPALLERGREPYDISCAPCHDRTGSGEGMIVLRGLRRPPSFHEDRLRTVPDGHLVDVMAKGFGAMPAYAGQVSAPDR